MFQYPIFATALCIITVALLLFLVRVIRQRGWVRATGRVIGYGAPRRNPHLDHVPIHERYEYCETDRNHFPIVRFQTLELETISICREGFEFASESLGKEIKLLYNPKNPEEFCSRKFLKRFPIELTISTVGLLFLGMGISIRY